MLTSRKGRDEISKTGLKWTPDDEKGGEEDLKTLRGEPSLQM